MEKFNITANNLYNWDEKGFILGTASSSKRIMTLEAFESGRITHASQDGSREFISLLACIGADGVALPPALIYKGESGTLQDTWLEDWKPENPAYFTVSPNGWSCGALGLDWLTRVFHRCTEKKAGNRRHLLIVDGHSSHVNMCGLLISVINCKSCYWFCLCIQHIDYNPWMSPCFHPWQLFTRTDWLRC